MSILNNRRNPTSVELKRCRPVVLPFAAAGVMALVLSSCTATDASDSIDDQNREGQVAAAQHYDLLPEEIQEAGKILVGMSPTGTPFSMQPEDEFEGMLPELSDSVSELLGVDMEIVSTAFPNQIPSLQAERIDMIWGANAVNEETEEVLDFVTYLRSPMKPILLKENDLVLKEEEDLCDAKVGAVQGGQIHSFLEDLSGRCAENGNPMDLNLYDSSSAAMTQLQAGQVDTFLGMGAIQDYTAATMEDGEALRVAELEVLPTIYGMAFQKGETELQNALMEALKTLVEQGDYEEILSRYHAESAALTADEVMINGVGSGDLK